MNRAVPGTAIFVREGVYTENIRAGGGTAFRLLDATADAPVTLISADGRGAAVIAPRDATQTTVNIHGPHFHLRDFEIRGGAWQQNDEAPIKITTNSLATGRQGVVIAGNIITGTGVDAIKAANTRGLTITDNLITATVREDFIDFVTVWDSMIAFNTMIGEASRAMNFKAGSQNLRVTNNLIDMASSPDTPFLPVIGIGGDGFSRDDRDPLPAAFRGFEARNVTVSQNVITGDNNRTAWFRGAVDSTFSNNLLYARGEIGISSERSVSSSPYDSRNNAILDNVYREGMTLSVGPNAQTQGLRIARNRLGDNNDLNFRVGVDREHVRDLDSLFEPAPVVGDYTFIVRAGGTGGRTAPQFQFFVDGELLGTRTINNPISGTFTDSGYRNYAFDYRGVAPSEIEIRFINAGRDSATGTPIRLNVDYLQVNGVRFESEHLGLAFRADRPDRPVGRVEELANNGSFFFDRLFYSERWPDPRNPETVVDSAPDLSPPQSHLPPVDGEAVLTIRAAGTGTDSAPPRFNVIVNGVTIATEAISSPGIQSERIAGELTFETFRYVLPRNPNSVVIDYFNDGGGAGQFNRDLIIEHIAVNGRRFTAEDNGVYVRRNGEVLTETDTMLWNGEMRFDNLNTVRGMTTSRDGNTLIVRVAGSGSDAAPPAFHVLADGERVASETISTPVTVPEMVRGDLVFDTFIYTLPSAPRSIAIDYFNDGGGPTRYNRNLVVDHIEINGNRFDAAEDGIYFRTNGEVLENTPTMLWNGVMLFDGL